MGYNGGDGEGGNGGAGSGLNLSSIRLEQFTLSPGDGGKKHQQGNFHCGGGGGGIMVDGVGPQDKDWVGQGYGGGQGGYNRESETPGSPRPGVVLLEIKKKKKLFSF